MDTLLRFKPNYLLNRLPVVIIMLVMGLTAHAIDKPFLKNNFAGNDVFKSAVFLENKGLVQPYKGEKVFYYTNHNNINAYFTEKGLIYKVQSIDKKKEQEIKREQAKEAKEGKKEEKEEEARLPIATSNVTVQFEGSNPHPQIEVKEKGEGYYTYKVGNGSLVTEGYKRLIYKEVYPGIDIEFSFPDKGGIEYNVNVSPGADPDQVKIVYGGMLKKISKNASGDIVVHTGSGDLIEHAPVSFTTNKTKVASQFALNGKAIKFQFPSGYDKKQGLVIDPWVVNMTSLPPENVGLRVDYDFLGNLFVYGAGPTYDQDQSNYFEVAKYSPNGIFQWTFVGNIPAITWNTIGSGWNEIGGFITEKTSGKCYMSPGYEGAGSQIIRIGTTGLYDNFVSVIDPNFQEAWGFAYNCLSDNILALGGGTNSNLNMGVINLVSGAVTTANITGINSGNYQDILCGTYDTSGSLYVIMNDGLGILPYTNTIYKVNSTYNGYVWAANSNFTPFQEVANDPYWGAGNWFNGLASNSSYLFYYDGQNVAAYQFSNGAMVGTAYTIPGYTAKYQAGIAVDNCNHVYIGGRSVIKTFTFNGSAFTPGADIPLGAGFTGQVYDIKYNSTNNLLYVTGDSLVGTYVATLSVNCSTFENFTVSHTTTCSSATATITPSAGLNPLVFNYVWLDGASNVLSQTTGSASLTNTATGLSTGIYYVQVQWNTDCGGTSVTDTVIIHCGSDSISPDTTICRGNSVRLSFTDTSSGGTYAWAPGGYNTAIINVAPIATTTYVVTFTPTTGPAIVDSVKVIVLPLATLTVNDTAICQGDSATLSAAPSLTGGTYLWSPGGATTASITVSPLATTTYYVTYTAGCNAPVDSGIVTVQPVTLTPHGATTCQGTAANISVTPSIAGGTYLWSPGGGNTQTISVTQLSTGTYWYTVTYVHGQCSVTDSASVLVDSVPTLSIANDTICQGSQGNLASVASLTGGTYNWVPGNFATANISASPAQTTSYKLTYTLAGCVAVDSASIVVDPMPVLTMTGDSICIGNGGQVSVSSSVAGTTYLWNTSDVTATVAASPAATTTYTVTATAALCTASGSATITVLPLPTVAVIGDTVCAGTPVNLTATPSYGTGTYRWSPVGSQAQTITVSPTSTTTYTVTFTIAGCGSAVDSAMVKIYQIPTVTTTDTAFCNGFSGQISATPSIPGGTYLWAPGGGNTAAITVSPQTTSTYTVTYTVNGCSTTGNATATVHQNPIVQVSGVRATCGQPNGTEAATVTSGTSPYTYLWSNAATTNNISQLAGNTSYSVTVLDNFQCSGTGSAFIDQLSAVVASATGFNETCPGYSDGWAGSTATGGLAPYTFVWSNAQVSQNISGLAVSNYVVTASDVTGCTASAQVTVADVMPNTFSYTAQPTSCYGQQYTDGSLAITPNSFLRQPFVYSLNAVSYQASDTFNNLAFGNYNVTVKDDSGCIVAVNNINVPEAAEATLDITPANPTVNLGQSVTLSANLSPFSDSSIVSYIWGPSEYLSCQTCPNPVVTPYAPEMIYTLNLVYNDHCTIDASVTVHMNDNPDIYIPNVFTPNGDGNNDIFYVYGANIKQFNIKIFNRWGEKVFESNDQQTGWDGRYKGVKQDPNVYVYEAYFVLLDNTTFHKNGSVTLVR